MRFLERMFGKEDLVKAEVVDQAEAILSENSGFPVKVKLKGRDIETLYNFVYAWSENGATNEDFELLGKFGEVLGKKGFRQGKEYPVSLTGEDVLHFKRRLAVLLFFPEYQRVKFGYDKEIAGKVDGVIQELSIAYLRTVGNQGKDVRPGYKTASGRTIEW